LSAEFETGRQIEGIGTAGVPLASAADGDRSVTISQRGTCRVGGLIGWVGSEML
jgi:hypothetical protein